MDFSAAQRQVLLDTARSAIRAILSGKSPAPLENSGDELLDRPAGCFVSLHELETHRLRGCVGQLEARHPLLLAVQKAAIDVLEDPRFTDDPVKLDELPQLEIELTILSPLKPARHALDFEPLSQGIYLTLGQRGGCFLPQVARETQWDRQQLLERLCTEKLCLPAHAWRDPAATLHTFDAVIIGPHPFDSPSASLAV